MWKLIVWPTISTVLILLYHVYELFFPCDSGFFIAGCELGWVVLYVFTIETWVVYAAISWILIFVEKRSGRSIPPAAYGLLGFMVAVLLLLDSLRPGINTFILLFLFGKAMDLGAFLSL